MQLHQLHAKLRNRLVPFLLLALAPLVSSAAAQPNTDKPTTPTATAQQAAFDTTDFAAVLAAHVDDAGLVDYAALKADRAPLDRFVASLAAFDPARFAQFSEDEKIAFWINAYNALTLQLIVDNYPIKATGLSAWRFPSNSIRQIAGVWEKPTWNIMDRQLSLHDIEHNILRAEFTQPGIHMGLNCASMGCPPLRAEPYTADKLQAQLDEMAARFFANPEKFSIDPKRKRINISPIFDWFTGDWVKARYHKDSPLTGFNDSDTAILEYARRHTPGADWSNVDGKDYKVKFLDYDWSLNEQ